MFTGISLVDSINAKVSASFVGSEKRDGSNSVALSFHESSISISESVVWTFPEKPTTGISNNVMTEITTDFLNMLLGTSRMMN